MNTKEVFDRNNTYRGKSIDSGEWKFGSLVRSCDDCYIVSMSEFVLSATKVDPETVGMKSTVCDDTPGTRADKIELGEDIWRVDEWPLKHVVFSGDIVSTFPNVLDVEFDKELVSDVPILGSVGFDDEFYVAWLDAVKQRVSLRDIPTSFYVVGNLHDDFPAILRAKHEIEWVRARHKKSDVGG